MIDRGAIRQRWELFGSKLDERGQRHFAAVEAMTAGRGGIVAIHEITGIARSTIGRGLDELDGPALPDRRVRHEGGGRHEVADIDPTLLADLQRLVEPVTMGDPERPLKWVSKSPVKLADELRKQGHEVSPNTVSKLLSERLEYSRQVNRKTHEGASHPDRNAQFAHINAKVAASMAAGVPVISVDTKKKELIGNYRNGGSDWRPKGDPHRVKVHDFEDKELGKVVPYGVYDIAANTGWVSLGITSDTAEFAVASIRTWIDRIGRERYHDMSELRITADCGGSNGARVRLWKVELQKLANTTGLTLHVNHYPPGTSKWNKIEHRLFCHITQNWRGQPLESRAAVIELIGRTTTKTGLKVECALDERTYETGIRISKAQMRQLAIEGDTFHPEWNYTITPRSPQPP
jgi:Rhodopirellula transposase DDE domain